MFAKLSFVPVFFIVCLALVAPILAQERGVFRVNWRIRESMDYKTYLEQYGSDAVTDKAFQSLLNGPGVLLANPIFNTFMPNPRLEWGHVKKMNEYIHYVSFDLGQGKSAEQVLVEVNQAANNPEAYDALNQLLESQGYFKVEKITFSNTKYATCLHKDDPKKNTCGGGGDCFPCLPGATCTTASDCAFKCDDAQCTQYNSASVVFYAPFVFAMIAIVSMMMMF